MNPPGFASRLFYAAFATAMSLLLSGSAFAQWDVPDTLEAAVDALDEDQAAFITSGDVLDFIPERQLEHELSTRDPESLGRFIDDLMAVAADMAYDPERDMGAAPLNLESSSFHNRNVTTPAPLRDFERTHRGRSACIATSSPNPASRLLAAPKLRYGQRTLSQARSMSPLQEYLTMPAAVDATLVMDRMPCGH